MGPEAGLTCRTFPEDFACSETHRLRGEHPKCGIVQRRRDKETGRVNRHGERRGMGLPALSRREEPDSRGLTWVKAAVLSASPSLSDSSSLQLSESSSHFATWAATALAF